MTGLPFPQDGSSGGKMDGSGFKIKNKKAEVLSAQNVCDDGSVVWGSSGKREELLPIC